MWGFLEVLARNIVGFPSVPFNLNTRQKGVRHFLADSSMCQHNVSNIADLQHVCIYIYVYIYIYDGFSLFGVKTRNPCGSPFKPRRANTCHVSGAESVRRAFLAAEGFGAEADGGAGAPGARRLGG